MDRNSVIAHGKGDSEGELLKSIRSRGKYCLETNLTNSKALLARQTGRNGDNAYNLLVHLISTLLDDPPVNIVDHFEEYCRLAKIDFHSTERSYRRAPGPNRSDGSVEKQTAFAKRILDALTQIESENICFRPDLSNLLQQRLNTMGWDLPFGYDYFISTHIERTLRSEANVKSCEFWGVIRSLGCDYYILELEHREKSVDYCAVRGIIGAHPEMVTNVVDELIEVTVRKTNESNETNFEPWREPFETVKEITDSLILKMIRQLGLVDSEIEEEDCRMNIEALLTVMIDHLSCTPEDSSTTFSSDSADPCASERYRVSAESTPAALRIRLERMQVESRLNSRSYLVTDDPRTKPWHRLPLVTLEQLQATEGLRVFLVGNLQAPVRGIVKPFDGLEENLLRALIAKISAHRDGHINGSETNISLVQCISGTYGSVTGCNHEMLEEVGDRWCERKEQGMLYWTSETWPGLSTFNDGEQFRCCYFGWGLEKLSHCYSPIVRIPKMKDEYGA